MKKNQDKKHLLKAAIPALLFAVYVVLDYLNIPKLLGLSSDKINMDFFDVFLNSVIVVVLYIVTYYFVDKKQIQKDGNAKDTADVLLLYTYKECAENLKLLQDSRTVGTYIIPKIDGNKPLMDNRVAVNFLNSPFSTKNEILELSKEGYLEKSALSTYFEIQKEYRFMVEMRITFFDLKDPQTLEQQALYESINRRSSALNSLLDSETKRLQA